MEHRAADAVAPAIAATTGTKKDLEFFYNDAHYFILGSHREGSGYALCEAMACGCVPIVTKISSFEKMTDNGDCFYLFDPGNAQQLKGILLNLKNDEWQMKHLKVLKKFEKDLSPEAIGNGIREICQEILQK